MEHLPISIHNLAGYLFLMVWLAEGTTNVEDLYRLRRELEEATPELLKLVAFRQKKLVDGLIKDILQYLQSGNFDTPSHSVIFSEIEHFQAVLSKKCM
jgi:hypothetical protein